MMYASGETKDDGREPSTQLTRPLPDKRSQKASINFLDTAELQILHGA